MIHTEAWTRNLKVTISTARNGFKNDQHFRNSCENESCFCCRRKRMRNGFSGSNARSTKVILRFNGQFVCSEANWDPISSEFEISGADLDQIFYPPSMFNTLIRILKFCWCTARSTTESIFGFVYFSEYFPARSILKTVFTGRPLSFQFGCSVFRLLHLSVP